MGNRNTHLLVAIKDGLIDLSLDYGLGNSRISRKSQTRVDDGVFHHLQVYINRKRTDIFIDNDNNKGMRNFQTTKDSRLYFVSHKS